MDEPEGLQRFPPRLCGLLRNLVAVLRNLLQLRLTLRVHFLRCHLRRQLAVAVCMVDRRRVGNQQCLVELQLLDCFRLFAVHLVHCFQNFLDDALETDLQYLLIVAAHMAYAGIHVVACVEHCVRLACLALRAHQRPRIIAHRVALPVVIKVAHHFLVLFGNVELVARSRLHRLQLIGQVCIRVLDTHVRRTRMHARRAYDQLFITDHDRQIVEQVLIHLRTAHDCRHAFRFLVRLCYQLCAIRFHHRSRFHDHLFQPLHSVRRFRKAFLNHCLVHVLSLPSSCFFHLVCQSYIPSANKKGRFTKRETHFPATEYKKAQKLKKVFGLRCHSYRWHTPLHTSRYFIFPTGNVLPLVIMNDNNFP